MPVNVSFRDSGHNSSVSLPSARKAVGLFILCALIFGIRRDALAKAVPELGVGYSFFAQQETTNGGTKNQISSSNYTHLSAALEFVGDRESLFSTKIIGNLDSIALSAGDTVVVNKKSVLLYDFGAVISRRYGRTRLGINAGYGSSLLIHGVSTTEIRTSPVSSWRAGFDYSYQLIVFEYRFLTLGAHASYIGASDYGTNGLRNTQGLTLMPEIILGFRSSTTIKLYGAYDYRWLKTDIGSQEASGIQFGIRISFPGRLGLAPIADDERD